MLRYLDVITGEMQRMRVAWLSRGYDPRWIWQARASLLRRGHCSSGPTNAVSGSIWRWLPAATRARFRSSPTTRRDPPWAVALAAADHGALIVASLAWSMQ